MLETMLGQYSASAVEITLVTYHDSPHSCFISLFCVPIPPAMESRHVAERKTPQTKGIAMEILRAVLRGHIARATVIVYLKNFLVLLIMNAAPDTVF
jgi:hypothetical protein